MHSIADAKQKYEKALEKRKPKPSTDNCSTLEWYPRGGERSHHLPTSTIGQSREAMTGAYEIFTHGEKKSISKEYNGRATLLRWMKTNANEKTRASDGLGNVDRVYEAYRRGCPVLLGIKQKN